MRVLVPVLVIGIIAVTVIIVLVLKNVREARIGKFRALQEDRDHYRRLFNLTKTELKTIVDTDGEGAALTAQLALDEVETQVNSYNSKKELENA